MVKIKRRAAVKATQPSEGKKHKDVIEGCYLFDLVAREGWPTMAKGVLANTFFRVTEATGKVRACVTIMPDGLKVAWDSCGKCHSHITICECKSGIYHPSSIGWIRATYDIDYPTERVRDYSMYFDPFGKLDGREVDSMTEVPKWTRKPFVAKTPVRSHKQETVDVPVVKATSETSITVKDIESLDMMKLNKQAEQQAKRTVRRARSMIRGGK